MQDPPRNHEPIAIIGGGLSGLACAFYLRQTGFATTIFEASPQWGGRARAVARFPIDSALGVEQCLDNGPHLMMGAYEYFLSLCFEACCDAEPTLTFTDWCDRYFYRTPFAWSSPSLRLQMGEGKSWRSFWQSCRQSQGLTLPDYGAIVRLICDGQWGSRTDETIAQWLGRLKIPARLREELLIPLALSALNTDPAVASANSFRAVLRRVFLSPNKRLPLAPATMLWSRVDFNSLYLRPILTAIQPHSQFYLNHRVREIAYEKGRWQLKFNHDRPAQSFSQVIVATAPWAASAIFSASALRLFPQAESGSSFIPQSLLQTQAIGNVFLGLDEKTWRALQNRPILHYQSWAGYPMIWLNHAPIHPHYVRRRPSLTAIFSARLPDEVETFAQRALPSFLSTQFININSEVLHTTTIVEKQATHTMHPQWETYFNQYAKQAHLPWIQKGDAKLWLSGDYLLPPLPATLESACQRAYQVSRALIEEAS